MNVSAWFPDGLVGAIALTGGVGFLVGFFLGAVSSMWS